jgi:integrase/recombinase XerC
MPAVIASETAEGPSSAAGAPLDSVGGGLVDLFLSWLLDGRGFSSATVATYRAAIVDFLRSTKISDFRNVSPQTIDRYLTRSALRGLMPNTRRTRFNALKTFFKFLASRGHIETDPTAIARGPGAKTIERIPTFTEKEIERLIFAYSEPPLARGRREPAVIFARRERVAAMRLSRDTAMLALAYTLGLRASELGRLNVLDYVRSAHGAPVLTLRESKWAKEPVSRRVDDRVSAVLDLYIAARFAAGLRHGALFPPLAARRADTHEPDRGIGRTQVASALARRVRLAEIDVAGRRLSPHVLRYSIATHLYGAGMRDRELQAFMRHRSIETTFRYVRLGSERQIQNRAIGFLPWNRRGLGRLRRP